MKSKFIPELAVFDLDNTLYEYGPCHEFGLERCVKYFCEYFNVSQIEIGKAFKASRFKVKDRLIGVSARDRMLYFSEMLTELNLKHDTKFLIEAYERYWKGFLSKMQIARGALSLLQELRQMEVATALVTDLSSEIQYRKMIALDIHDYFDYVVTSQETQLEKSSGQPFELLLLRMQKTQFERVWFIGDAIQDFPANFPATESRFFLSPYSKRKLTGTKRIMDFEDLRRTLH